MKSIDYKQGEKIAFYCILGNIALSLIKLSAGIFGHSKAMVADALHSASDIITTIIVLAGIKIAGKPVDKEHPYGHGKIEPIAAAFVGISLIYAAIMIIKGIIEAIITHSFTTPTFPALGAAVFSMAVKEVMFRITYSAGKEINSESIIADAWHHRSDAYSSIGTFFGILGSMAGKWLNIHFLEYLDPVSGAIVASLIFKVAYDILKHSVKGLMDSSPGTEKINIIKEAAESAEGIVSVPEIKARYIGQYLFVDIKIEVDSSISVEEGHNIAVLAENKILEYAKDVYEVMVHVDPVETPQESI